MGPVQFNLGLGESQDLSPQNYVSVPVGNFAKGKAPGFFTFAGVAIQRFAVMLY